MSADGPNVECVTRVGVFNLDNAIVRGCSLFDFGHHLARQGMLKRSVLLRFALPEWWYARGRGEMSGVPERAALLALRVARGRECSTLRDLASAWAPGFLASRGYGGTLAMIDHLKGRGHLILIATSSPQELAEACAAALNADGAIGTVADVRSGCYSGRLQTPLAHGPNKAHRVVRWLLDHDVDLDDCWGFSGSSHDLPLLNAMGTPVAVNADRRLAHVARERGWHIVDGADPLFGGLVTSVGQAGNSGEPTDG